MPGGGIVPGWQERGPASRHWRSVVLDALDLVHVWGEALVVRREWVARSRPTRSHGTGMQAWTRMNRGLRELGIATETGPLEEGGIRLTSESVERIRALARQLDAWLELELAPLPDEEAA